MRAGCAGSQSLKTWFSIKWVDPLKQDESSGSGELFSGVLEEYEEELCKSLLAGFFNVLHKWVSYWGGIY